MAELISPRVDQTNKRPNQGKQDVSDSSDADVEHASADSESTHELNKSSALYTWLLLCYAAGPTFAVNVTYVPAVIQSLTNLLGHRSDGTTPCAREGQIDCRIKFGPGDVNYNSFVLYLNAISRACDGVCIIITSGLADYSAHRKHFITSSTILLGFCALPFAALTASAFSSLTAISVLHVAITTVNGVAATMEGSYIPLFMRAARITGEGGSRITNHDSTATQDRVEREERDQVRSTINRGSRVSAFGLVAGHLGSLTALLVGIIISYTRSTPQTQGYTNFLLAITIAGCLTVITGSLGGFFLPSIKGKPMPTKNVLFLVITRWYHILRRTTKYPEAFKLIIGWILWNNANSNFDSIINLLFREVYGLNVGSSNAVYTVFIFTAVISASLGNLAWTYLFPHLRASIKSWAYFFLFINGLCIFWGCIGISDRVTIGYKHGVEFWIKQAFFNATSSALRATNQVILGSMIPRGHEAQFFGLEVTLDLATGWIGPLLTAKVQDSANNLRVPMVIQLVLLMFAAALYWWTDVDKGRKDALVVDDVDEK